MKKTKVLIAMTLLFSASMTLWKCHPNDDDIFLVDPITQETKRKTNKIPFKSLPSKLKKNVTLIHEISEKNKSTSGELLIFDESQIIEVIDSLSNSKFSLKFTIPNQPENVLFNLILGVDSSNQEIEPFVLKYTIDNPEEVYATLIPDFTKMIGTISEYDLNSFLYNLEYVYSSDFDRTVEEVPPCERYSNGGDPANNNSNGSNSGDSGNTGGGGTTGGTTGDGNDYGTGNGNDHDASGGGEFVNTDNGDGTNTNCTILVWSNGETGDVTGISWSCSDGSSGYGDLDRTTETEDCPGDGEVGINDGESFFVSPDDPIENVEEYFSCFDLSQGAEITIYVDQPIANSDIPFTFRSGKAGHAFIGLSQNGTTRFWGLYPEGNSNPISPNHPFVFGNNQNDSFDVSISYSIDSSTLSSIINSANAYNQNYDLNTNNCTDYVIYIASLTGHILPDPQSNWTGGGGSNPGAFGQELREMSLPSGMARNVNGGTSGSNLKTCN